MDNIEEVDITDFVNRVGLEKAASGRYSLLLAANLYACEFFGIQNPEKIVREIELLEKNKHSNFKPAIQNRHPPLKGLWHKHYLQDGLKSLAINVVKGLDRYHIPFFERKIKEASDAGEDRYLGINDIPELVDDIIIGNRQRLASQQSLTGEWLVFAKHEGKNYYLTITTHDNSEHEKVRQQINDLCCKEFPFLEKLMNES